MPDHYVALTVETFRARPPRERHLGTLRTIVEHWGSVYVLSRDLIEDVCQAARRQIGAAVGDPTTAGGPPR
jgi:hypothetical protein